MKAKEEEILIPPRNNFIYLKDMVYYDLLKKGEAFNMLKKKPIGVSDYMDPLENKTLKVIIFYDLTEDDMKLFTEALQ